MQSHDWMVHSTIENEYRIRQYIIIHITFERKGKGKFRVMMQFERFLDMFLKFSYFV